MSEKSSKRETIDQSDNSGHSKVMSDREEKLAKQLRDNLMKRKQQSRARNTKPRKFKKTAS